MTAPGKTTDLVSVVIPCHNAADYVGETIRSVLRQTYAPLEIVAVDDASTDATWGVLESWGDRIRAVRLAANQGASAARNCGAEVARGAYLMFLDADDLIAPETLEELIGVVADVPNSIGFCDWRRLIKEGGRWRTAPAEVPLPSEGSDVLGGWIEGSSWIPTCSILWTSDAFERTGGWNESLSLNDDGELMMRALIHGVTLVRATGGLAYYRRHESRASVSSNIFEVGRLASQEMILERVDGEIQAHLGDRYQQSIGYAYRRLAAQYFHAGDYAKGRQMVLEAAKRASRRLVSPTRVGRGLERALGLEAKERLTRSLARLGLQTGARRRMDAMRSQTESRTAGPDRPDPRTEQALSGRPLS